MPALEVGGSNRGCRVKRNDVLGELTLADGTRFVFRVAAAAADSGPIVVIIPALGIRSRFYEGFARRLAEQGLTAVTVDLRGQGESGPRADRRSRHGYRELVETDLPRVIDFIRGALAGRPLWIVGHSLGGQLSLVHAGIHAHSVSGVVLIASGSAWHGGFTGFRRPRNLVFSQLFVAVAYGLGFWPGDAVGFGGRQSRVLMRDWARQVRTGSYAGVGSELDYEQALRDLTAPVLAVEIEGDTLAPVGAVTHLCDKIPNASVTRWRYTRALSGTVDLGHFAWARHSPGLAEHVTEWVREHTA